MAALASKTESKNIFAKLNTKPANKVSSAYSTRSKIPSIHTKHMCACDADDTNVDMLRLRREESDMDVCAVRHLPLP